jgi:hypothetical protein
MARRAVALPALDGLFLAAFLDPWGVAMIGCGEMRSLTAEGPM